MAEWESTSTNEGLELGNSLHQVLVFFCFFLYYITGSCIVQKILCAWSPKYVKHLFSVVLIN